MAYRDAVSGWIWAKLIEPVDRAELDAWNRVRLGGDPRVVTRFIQSFPDGRYVERAERLRAALTAVPKAANATTDEKSETPNVSGSLSDKSVVVAAESLAGRYAISISFSPSSHNLRWSGESIMECKSFVIDSDLFIKEKKLDCMEKGRWTEWYIRGRISTDDRIANIKFWSAYGTGEYYFKGPVDDLRKVRGNNDWSAAARFTKE